MGWKSLCLLTSGHMVEGTHEVESRIITGETAYMYFGAYPTYSTCLSAVQSSALFSRRHYSAEVDGIARANAYKRRESSVNR